MIIGVFDFLLTPALLARQCILLPEFCTGTAIKVIPTKSFIKPGIGR